MLSNVHIHCFWGEKKRGKSDITNTPPHCSVSLRGDRDVTCLFRGKSLQSDIFQEGSPLQRLEPPPHGLGGRAFRREIRRSGISEQQVWQGKQQKKSLCRNPPKKGLPWFHQTSIPPWRQRVEPVPLSLVMQIFALQCQSRWSSNQIKTDTA